MRNSLLVIYANIVIASCSPKNAEVAKISNVETVPQGEISEGRDLFTTHCDQCHELPEVSNYSREKWQKIIPVMAKEARLNLKQESKIASYVNWKLQQR